LLDDIVSIFSLSASFRLFFRFLLIFFIFFIELVRIILSFILIFFIILIIFKFLSVLNLFSIFIFSIYNADLREAKSTKKLLFKYSFSVFWVFAHRILSKIDLNQTGQILQFHNSFNSFNFVVYSEDLSEICMLG
jgi:hypothetical protein